MEFASWQKRIQNLCAVLKEGQPKDAVEHVAPAFPNHDFVLTINGNIGNVCTADDSDLAAKVEGTAISFTIAVVDVSFSMSKFIKDIDKLVADIIAKCSEANLPQGLMTIVCFSHVINATIDMSVKYTANIADMTGGTDYSVAFDHVTWLIKEKRKEFPNATFNVAFMTDGENVFGTSKAPQALQALHDQLCGPGNSLKAVYFSLKSNDKAPESLHGVSLPPVELQDIPTLLLTDMSYFTNWLLGALEKSFMRTSLQFAMDGNDVHVLLNNNGEVMTGSLMCQTISNRTEDLAVQGTLTSGGASWPCTVLLRTSVIRSKPPTKEEALALLLTQMNQCLIASDDHLNAAISSVQEVLRMTNDSNIRQHFSEIELKLLKKAAAAFELQGTGPALTSQRVDQRASFEALIGQLMFFGNLSLGKKRRRARAVEALGSRIAQNRDAVECQFVRLQTALERLQARYIADNTKQDAEAVKRPDDTVCTLNPISPGEVVISLWTGPNTEDAHYMGNVALNAGNVRAQPLLQTPWIGLNEWVMMCNANLTATNSTNIGIPVFDHHASELTDDEREVVECFAPLLCWLFATGQPLIESSHVAVSQLFTIIGHTLQTMQENRAQAEQYANVILPYAWYLYTKLGVDTMTALPITDRYKNAKNCIGSATAWLGFVYCHRQMVREPTMTTDAQWFVYKQEVLRTLVKRLNDTSQEANTLQLQNFILEARNVWPQVVRQCGTVTMQDGFQNWDSQSQFNVVVQELVRQKLCVADADLIDRILRALLDTVGSQLKSYDRLGPAVLLCAEAFDCWKIWTDTTELTVDDLYQVITNSSSGEKFDWGKLDAALGGHYTSVSRSQFLDVLCANFEALTPTQGWIVLRQRPDVATVPKSATLANFALDKDNICMVAADVHPAVRAWFQSEVTKRNDDWDTVLQELTTAKPTSKLLYDARFQFWCITQLKAPDNLFAQYLCPAKVLWRDASRRGPKTSMNHYLSTPGSVVIDRGNKRLIVNKVVFDEKKPFTVSRVVFNDGSIIERTIAGGQRNSVTALLLTAPFEDNSDHQRIKVQVNAKHNIPFEGAGPILTRPIDVLGLGASNIAGYVCARDGGDRWILESVYQQQSDKHTGKETKYIDIMARGDLVYFDDRRETK